MRMNNTRRLSPLAFNDLGERDMIMARSSNSMLVSNVSEYELLTVGGRVDIDSPLSYYLFYHGNKVIYAVSMERGGRSLMRFLALHAVRPACDKIGRILKDFKEFVEKASPGGVYVYTDEHVYR